MFEEMTLEQLQIYWWVLIGILGAALVFLLFVQGGQSLIYTLGKEKKDRDMMLSCLAHRWELTFTTLVTFGGAFFASFPLFYATSFGGAYWAWIVLLFCFIVQAVSYSFKDSKHNLLGKGTYEAFLFINGIMAPLLIGVVVGSFFTGSSFILNSSNSVSWTSSLRGLELLFSISNLSLGLSILFLSRVLGNLYFINNISEEAFLKKAKKSLFINTGLLLVFFLYWLISLLFKDGFAISGESLIVVESNKYLHNLLEMPWNTSLLLAGVVLLLLGIGVNLLKKPCDKGIWISGLGSSLIVFSVFMLAGLNNTSFYPSTSDLQSSLSIRNASSSQFTLMVMSYVSLLIPIVIAYIYYVFKVLTKKKVDLDNVEGHDY